MLLTQFFSQQLPDHDLGCECTSRLAVSEGCVAMLDVFPKYIGYPSYRTYYGPCCTWNQDCEPERYLNCTFGRNFVYHGERGDL